MSGHVTIQGIQEAQKANLRAIAVMEPRGKLGRVLQLILPELHRYAVSITHVWIHLGGALRAAHRMKLLESSDATSARGSIFIDPSAVNPRGQRPEAYGMKEHARGGSHAFYGRTMEEQAPQSASRALRFLQQELDRGN
jgi:hypothetical protein